MMEGFFITSTPKPKQARSGSGPRKSATSLSCPCGLNQTCKGPFMEVGGQGRKGILVIAEAPGQQEDEEYAKILSDPIQAEYLREGGQFIGQQLIGNAGQRVESELAIYGIDLHEDCWKINAVNCRPPKNRTPDGREIAACRPRVLKAIRELKPTWILVLGIAGVESLLGYRWHDEEGLGGLNRWRGMQCPDQELAAWICPTFHPSYVLRCQNNYAPEVPLWFGKDIEAFANLVEQNWFPTITPHSQILSEAGTIGKLRKILSLDTPIAFDYETTGLKPHTPGHRVVTASIAYQGEEFVESYSFEMTERVKPWWIKFLLSNVPKISHKLQFEEKWSRACFDAEVQNWCWDTMLAAHVLDNRGHISSLKFQTYANFGIIDYSSEIAPYLRADTSLGFNRIEEALKEKLLEYNALDSFYSYLLYKKQIETFSQGRTTQGIELLIDGAQALADDEENGLVVNLSYIQQQREHINKRVEVLKKRVLDSEGGKIWKSTFPTPNLGSNPQLATVLYDKMGLTPTKVTKKGNASVDDEALETLAESVPLVEDILQIRKLEKLSGTYLAGWEREAGLDHIIRAFYHLNTARTFRSSCSDPNFQNVPIRDKEAQRICRRGLYPRAGHHLLEVDYSGIEVRVSACYHKDPMMIKYIEDSTTDMHRDMAMECFLLEQEEVSKVARQGAKNQYVFPEFYGSYWKNVGPGLWKWAHSCETKQGINLLAHLKKKGIRALGDPKAKWPVKGTYLYHIKEVEDRFWGERFKVYAQWKKDWYEEYLEKGYFDTLTGFRCQGPMKRNDVSNYPIQGSAFHCLLQSKINTRKHLRDIGSEILPCGQIHDSGLFSVPLEELDRFCQDLKQIWCEELMAQWDWIIIPLEIEIDITPIDGSWFTKKPYEVK